MNYSHKDDNYSQSSNIQHVNFLRNNSPTLNADASVPSSGAIVPSSIATVPSGGAGSPTGSTPSDDSTNVASVKQSYNPLVKIFWFSIFCAILLKPIYNIFLFFGFDLITILLYMGWFIFLILILMFIPQQYSNINL
jgi:hypothetical protein